MHIDTFTDTFNHIRTRHTHTHTDTHTHTHTHVGTHSRQLTFRTDVGAYWKGWVGVVAYFSVL